MKNTRSKKGEKLKARISFHGRFDEGERKAIASWLRRAAYLFDKDPEYAEIKNFRLYY